MSGLGGGLTNFSNGLNGGAPPEYGLPNLPGMNDSYGVRDEIPRGPFTNNSRYFPSPAAAAVDYAKNRKVGEIPMNVDGQFDSAGNSELSASSDPAQGDSPNANIKRPGFFDAIKHGGLSPANPELNKAGKFLAFLGGLAKGAAEGSAGGGFGQGFLIANQQQRQDEQQRMNAVEHARQMARQQQQDARQTAEDKSQAELRQAQIQNYKAQAGKREQTPAEALLARRDAAVGMGLKEGSDEYNKVVFDLSPQKESGPGSPEQQYITEYRQKHPNAGVAEAIKAYASDHQAPERDINAGDKAIRRQARDLAGGLLGKHKNDSAAAAEDAANQLNTNRNLTPGQRRILSETLLTLRQQEPSYAPQ